MRSKARLSKARLIVCAAGCGVAIFGGTSAALADELYACTLLNTSTLGFNISATAPLTGTFKGADTTAVPPALATRTKTPPANFFTCGIIAGENDDVPFSGTGAVTGTGSNIVPTGTFRLGFDTSDNSAFIDSGSFSLLGASTATATTAINSLSASAFCATAPSCQVPISLSFNLPLGNGTISSVLAVQQGTGVGTITPTGVNTWDYAVAVTLLVTPSVTFNGGPLDTGTQTVPAALTGTITRVGSNITTTTTLNLNVNQTNPTPVPFPATPVNVTGAPLCNGMNLILAGTITSTSFAFTSNASLNASGSRVPCACDFDGIDGPTVADLFDFLDAWFVQNGQTAPGLSADFDKSGGVGVEDLFGFLDCWFSPPASLGC